MGPNARSQHHEAAYGPARARRRSRWAVVAVAAALACPFALPVGPAGAETRHSTASISVNGTYQPFTGDFDGDLQTDIFWYDPTTGADSIWYPSSTGFANKVTKAESVNAAYTPIVGDFAGNDGRDDILWYRPGTGADSLWIATSTRGTFTHTPITVNGTYEPIAGHFVGGDASADIYWQSQVAGTNSVVWRSNGNGAFTSAWAGATMAGSTVLKGNFKGNATDELFFYRPGAATDAMASFGVAGWPILTPMSVTGTYTPIVGDLYNSEATFTCYPGDGSPFDLTEDAENYSDIKWYGPGSAPDLGWHFDPSGNGARVPELLTVNGTFQPIVLHRLYQDTCDSIGPGSQYTSTDEDYVVWYAAAAGKASIGGTTYPVPANAKVLTGRTGDLDFIVYYRPGSASDLIQYETSYSVNYY